MFLVVMCLGLYRLSCAVCMCVCPLLQVVCRGLRFNSCCVTCGVWCVAVVCRCLQMVMI